MDVENINRIIQTVAFTLAKMLGNTIEIIIQAPFGTDGRLPRTILSERYQLTLV